MKGRVYLGIAAGAVLAASSLATDRDWPRWGGPGQDLVVAADGVFSDGFGLAVAWRRPLGPGYSSLSVADGRVVTFYSDGESDVLAALDAGDGRELWRYAVAPTYRGHSGSEDGPVGSPTIHAGTVYAVGPRGDLVAVRLADGHELWRRQLADELGGRAPAYGFGTVPLVAEGVLVVEAGGDAGRSICGFDPATGELLWSVEDDTVGYPAPRLVEIDGTPQVVAVTDLYLLGLEPANGEVLWKHRHSERPEPDGCMSRTVVAGDGRILLHFWPEAALFDVSRRDGAWTVEERWRGPSIKNLTVMPIYDGGYLYGFNGRFLTGVEAATGETAWKSRPPGPGGLAMVDGHLVSLGPKGVFTVAAVTPEGYEEKASLAVADDYSLAPPSFAGGRFFVRTMTEAVAVEVTRSGVRDGRPAVPTPAEIADAEQVPIVEDGGRRVHFVYRGDAEAVGLAGNFLDVGEQVPMERLAGTDVHVRTVALEPGGRWEYRFVLDFDVTTTDPRNPRRVATPDGFYSVLTTPGWAEPAHLAEPTGERGRLESFRLRSEIRGNWRDVHVYLPPGYDEADARYPLAIVHDGGEALRFGALDRSLDGLVGQSVAPVVVAFVSRERGSEYGSNVADHARMIVEELVPRLESRYRLRPERALLGTAEGGFAAAWTAVHHPGVFAGVAVQSFYFDRYLGDELSAAIAALESRPDTWYVEWSRFDLKSAAGLQEASWTPRDAEGDSRRLAKLLKEKGGRIETVEVADGAGWGSWRTRTDRIFELFFPLGRDGS